ncbi:MAG: diguanylate cyclase/phosphodiesterase [Anaerocolumna sp.]|jgi:diguanylate cyclase (GGDEF)-like protein|nr:diguanylate cyclase/phosphodiesterase [Anaerocolumna sp.]
MDGKDNKLNNNYTIRQLMDFFSNISLPNDVISNFVEKEDYIEFIYDGKIYAALVNGDNWDEIKLELLIQKERKIKEHNRIRDLEKRDELTKLFNKEYSKHLIENFLESSEPGLNHALMIVDIDNFSIVNENLGYLFGDTVLVNIAENLGKIFYDTDIAGRIGGDEFIIFLKNISSMDLLKAKAEEIYSIFYNTYTGENSDYSMSCSIGIAMYPGDGKNYMELFENADCALIDARESKNTHYTFYSQIKHRHSTHEEDIFDKYNITKTRAYGSSNFDKEITAFAFDIMSRTKDVNSAINLLLNKVRIQFDCSHICIIENNLTDSDFHITYFSSKEGIVNQEHIDQSIVNGFKNMLPYFDENGIFYVNEAGQSNWSEKGYLLEEKGVQAILQCAMFENGVFKGCVSIDDCEKPRYWSQYEVDSLVTITRIISSYLLKMRASEKASKQLYYIKNYDALTGLPTLHKFKKDLKQLLSEHPESQYAIVYSDISEFKYINDTLGYDVGDKILCSFASMLTSDQTDSLCFARISGDSFLSVLLYQDEKSLEDKIINFNEQFNASMKSKYPANKFIVISGVSLIDSREDVTVAIDNANLARKSIKPATKTTCKFFNSSMKLKLLKEAEITNSMEQALKNGEFIVYLQPKIGLSENKLVGAEALVRWNKDRVKLMPPNDFIPIFEKNGFIVNLDFYIYEEVLKLLRTWLDQGKTVVPISVNVSRIHLNDENFVNEIKKLVDLYEIPYYLLELELTESIFLNNTEVALSAIKKLRQLGFGVSIDDFGAGYSSLNLLKDMATDVIKLDKEFFGQGEMQREEQIIVSSIISMAKQLNMKVLSEGVETKTQSEFLKSVSCDMAQGYLYSKPMPINEFEELIMHNHSYFV